MDHLVLSSAICLSPPGSVMCLFTGVALTIRQIATDESNEHLASHYAARNSSTWRVVDV